MSTPPAGLGLLAAFGAFQAQHSGSPSGETQLGRHGESGPGEVRSNRGDVEEEGERQGEQNLAGMSYRYVTCSSQNDGFRITVGKIWNLRQSKRVPLYSTEVQRRIDIDGHVWLSSCSLSVKHENK